MSKITFILPGSGHIPIGGFKVVYEYANGLAARGYDVIVVHPAKLLKDTPVHELPKKWIRYIQRRLDRSFRPNHWFKIHPKVRLLWVPSLNDRYIPDADAVVATAWQTAEWVADYPASKGKKLYLIQHLETWSGPEERVYNTWRLPLHKIVIARWLKDIANKLGQPATYIPNGLDFLAFGMDIKPEQRDAHRVMMLYHDAKWKGSADGLRALELAKREIPSLTAALFGVPPRPANLPEWIDYYRNPEQKFLRRLYNEAAVFVAPSWTEGWGLPPSEAMMCGAAVVATDIGGHREFARHEQTALLSPPKNPEALAVNLVRVLQDQALRLSLANNGHQFIKQFTWDRAVYAFQRVIFDASRVH